MAYSAMLWSSPVLLQLTVDGWVSLLYSKLFHVSCLWMGKQQRDNEDDCQASHHASMTTTVVKDVAAASVP